VRPRALIVTLAAGVLAAGCGGSSSRPATSVRTVVRTVSAPSAPAARATGGASVADVVARVLPGVVNVRTTTAGGGKGEGSGVVVDRAGLIVTNAHVIRNATAITVVFDDRRHPKPLPARAVGVSEAHDLAILRVAPHDLVPVPLGRSSRLRLGDGVLAIGFPLDLGGGPTVTQGIVSGLDRSVHAGGGPQLEGLLQTDAAINPGNSGGALVDAAGRLIGINTVAARSAENIGFAISIDDARPVIAAIRTAPAGPHAWLGVLLDSVGSADAAVQLGLAPSVRGAAVVVAYAPSPASRAGMREGDVIVALNGRPVRTRGDVARAILAHRPGDRLVLDVVDRSGPRRVTVRLAKGPATGGGSS
jgi:S1-C subfamily serine protease